MNKGVLRVIQPATSARRLALELSAVMENSRNVAPMESIAIAAKIDYLLVLSKSEPSSEGTRVYCIPCLARLAHRDDVVWNIRLENANQGR